MKTPMVAEMLEVANKSLSNLRAQIKNIRYGADWRAILFEFQDRPYSVPVPRDVVIVNDEAGKAWVLKQILDETAILL